MAVKHITQEGMQELFGRKVEPRLPEQIVIKHGYLTSEKEYRAMALLCSLANPKRVFEIGTFEGYSTWILAMNAPQAEVFTLDLPRHSHKTKYELGELNQEFIGYGGRMVFSHTRQAPKIRQLSGDSATFDYSGFKDSMDFVFIDGAMTYEYTKNDAEKALFITRKGGVVLWHDYNPIYWPDTKRFLDELSEKRTLYHIADTFLVFSIK